MNGNSSDPGVASAGLSGSTVTITALSKGTTTVTVTAADPGGLTAAQPFQVEVPNRAPVAKAAIPSDTVSAGATLTVDLANHFEDPDGDMLEYAAVSSTPAVARVAVQGRVLTITGVAKGTTQVTAEAMDPDGAAVEQSFTVTVPNRGPRTVGSIPAQSVVEGERTTVRLSGYFTDPDGDALSYAVSNPAPATATASVSGSALTIVGVTDGATTLTITASDPDGLTAAQTVNVTVESANRPREVTGDIPSQTVTEGQTVTVDLSDYFTDPDGDALTYSAQSLDRTRATASVFTSILTIRGVSPGGVSIVVTASDPGGLQATQTFSVRVGAANQAPRPKGTIPGQSVVEGGATTLDMAPYFEDPDGDALTYSATSSNSRVEVSRSGATLTIRGVSEGTATVTITARDPGGLTAEQQFRVTVTPAGAPDLEFSDVSPRSATVAPGDDVTVVFTIRNAGDKTSAATQTRAHQSRDDRITKSDRVVSNDIDIGAIRPSGTASVRLRIPVSSTADPGTTYFGMCVDPVSRESDTSNNCSEAFKLTIGSSGPDLTVPDVSPTSIVAVAGGPPIDLRFTVENVGNDDAPATSAKAYASMDETFTPADDLLATLPVGALPVRTRAVVTYPFRWREEGDRGYIGLCVDPVAGEGNENNNCSAPVPFGTVLDGGSQIVVRDVDPVSVSVVAGGTKKIVFVIDNWGIEDAPKSLADVYRSTDNIIDRTDTTVNATRIDVPKLKALETFNLEYPLTGDPADIGSPYYVGVCVDPVANQIQDASCSETRHFRSVATILVTASGPAQASVVSAPESPREPAKSEPPDPPSGPTVFTVIVESVEIRNPPGEGEAGW